MNGKPSVRKRSRLLAAPVVALLLLLAGAALAAPHAPPWPIYFSDNLSAGEISLTPTPMEQALLDEIEAAADSIDLAIYDFNRASVRDALLAARARGVSVRVVADDEERWVDARPFFDALAEAGVTIVADGPPPASAGLLPRSDGLDELLASAIMHDKYFIFDGARVWTGSVNMSDSDFTLNHNNALLLPGAAAAARYQADFDQMFGGAFGTAKSASLTTTLTISGVSAGLYFGPQDNPMQPIVAAVQGAEQSIDFAIFTFTRADLGDALAAAVRRGVTVRGLWDRLGAGNTEIDTMLCNAGAQIRIESTRGLMHNKVLVIDAAGAEPRVVTGSLNWTATGNRENNENTLILHDAESAAIYAAEFARMWDEMAADPCQADFRVLLPLVQNPGEVSPPPRVRITSIVYDPPGADVEGEVVTLASQEPTAVTLSGWKLIDAAANAYIFPAFSLSPGASVRVWVKAGANTPADLYWGRGSGVWNNDGDVATLRTAQNAIVASCAYTGTAGGEVMCP